MWDKTFRILLRFPDVAMVRFCVLDDDFVGDDFIGQYSLPLSSIQPGLVTALFSFAKHPVFVAGYRHIPLFSKSGEVLKHSTLFVHVSFEPAYTLKVCLNM